MDFVFNLLLLALLKNAFGEEFAVHPNVGHPHKNFDESEVVGNPLTRARLQALGTRARARALAQRTNLRLRHPLLLREQTPEEFLNSETHSEIDEPEPIVGAPNPIVGDAPYYNQPDHWDLPSNTNPYSPYYESAHGYDVSILPGQWTDNDYQGEYYDSYQVTPVSYVIPDDYQNYYRNADPHKKSKKKKKIVREEDEDDDEKQRHFHKHHAHAHSFMYHGNAPLHDVDQGHFQSHLQEGQSSFQSISNPSHLVTTNKQKNIIVLPPNNGNFQIAQLNGNQNAVSQAQAHLANNLHNLHSQTTQVMGTNNAVSQSQAPFVGYAPDSILGAPNIVQVKKRRQFWTIPGPEEADVSVVIKREVPNRQKRSAGLARLLLDPNAQVDVPKTLENAGTVVRNSFENKHAPAYHLRNAAGSARDAFISTLRIPPQNLFIPSRYEIVEREQLLNPYERTNAMNEIAKEYPETYNKVGAMFRDGVRSGQDTLAHMGDVIHSTKQALVTARTVAPRVVVSSLRIPAVQHPLVSRMKMPKENSDESEQNDPNFIGVSHVMDSFGLSNPRVPLERTFDDGNFYVVSDKAEEDMYKMLNALHDAIKAMGVNTLKDFFSKIKSLKAKQEKRMRNLRKSTGSRLKRVKNEDSRSDAIKELDMVVALASNVTEDLLNGASTEAPWDSKEDKEVADFLGQLFNRDEDQNESDDDERVGAINPVMFKKLFNTTLESAENFEYSHPAQKDKGGDDDQPVGIGMNMGKKLLTPFMGKLEKKEMHGYVYNDYGDSDEDYYGDYRKRRSSVNFIE